MRNIATTYYVDLQVKNSIYVSLGLVDFLPNSNNKMQLISILKTYMQEADCQILQTDDDADDKCPLELLTQGPSSLFKLRVFESSCYKNNDE